ncbi:MAG: endonuclease III [Thaumarchaeota archaeon]|nr:endonuclease III [Nitrososphaerota archaeon]
MNINNIFKLMHETLDTIRSNKQTTLNKIHDISNSDPFNILITTVLSARSKDKNTLKVAKKLFSMYKTPKTLANADISTIEKLIKSIGFYHLKSKRIIEISRIIHEEYNDEVPSSIEKLIRLPGVGRKTANCVLVYAFNKSAIPVDTHVHRISNRLGLLETKNAEKTELELMNIIPKKNWNKINEMFVIYGQNVCLPISPLCDRCKLQRLCKYNGIKNAS